MLTVFAIDLSIPLGVAGGVPYIAVILTALWLPGYKYVLSLAIVCSLLTLAGFYFSPNGGELWKVVFNRLLAIFAIWITATLAILWKCSEQKMLCVIQDAEKEKEKIYLATIHGAQHITNNLLNELQLVKFEIRRHKDFDLETAKMFDEMLLEADELMKQLSAVRMIDEENIKKSVSPGKVVEVLK